MRRVAVVHEWLVNYAGSERVLAEILQLFPQADLYVLVDFLPRQDRGFLSDRSIHTSFIQNLPFAASKFRSYLPLMPLAIEQFDLSSYELIISSNHAVAKGVITGPEQLHIAYVHSPMRYAWDLQHQYLREAGLERGIKSWVTRWLLHQLRQWDRVSGNGVDYFLANSQFIAKRIAKVYGRKAQVVYPPVDVEQFQPSDRPRENFYLTAARFVPYKKVDLIVSAFAAMPDRTLVVVGEGETAAKLRQIATPNIRFLPYQPPEQLKLLMQNCRAFVFAAIEDFGITLVEAQACGTPVIALGQGGARETVMPTTGVLFPTQ
ncbi:MAG: glycosyltransferase, partial [Pseudanabaenaceae cyanobacterium bins.68]|nr:glycosyltransferase [Pseudanabaenaceae cyanobacterium bins.68]